MQHVPWPAVAESRQPWDVVVLGAGPAGAIAARQLSSRGLRALLIDKATLPRDKVCGGCLGGAALKVLEAVGLGDLPARCGGVTLQRMQLASGGAVAEIACGRRIALSRRTFDDALVREAIHAGATVCDGTEGVMHASSEEGLRRVTLRCSGKKTTVAARVVLVATGLSRAPADFTTCTSRRSRIGLGALLNAKGAAESDLLRMAWGTSGYVGLAPVDGGRLDVAAAVDPQALAAIRSPGELVSRIMREAGLPWVTGLEDAAWRGTSLLTRQTRPLGSHRCLLIGDAAGYVEPFTGEGIGWAMASAVLASSLIVDQLGDWDAEVAQRWHRLYTDALIRNQRYCGNIDRLLRRKAIRRLVVWTLCRAPGLARPIVRQFDRSIFPTFPKV